jgi:hypothetical protein
VDSLSLSTQPVSDRPLYERDFYLWIQHTATALKAKDFDQLDYLDAYKLGGMHFKAILIDE